MNPLTAKTLRTALRATARRAELEEAARGLLTRAEREGLIDVAYADVDSPFGPMLVAGTDRGIVRVAFPHRDHDALLEELAAMISPRVLEAPERLDQVRRELDAYFEGRLDRFSVSLDWRLTHGFQNKALRAIARIPYGETRSYREIAAAAGNPRAFRAAGTACGANPLPPIVPCHRVILSDGEIGSYGGGPQMKESLLRLEGAL
jgi:methylated-DNA-[protein]-cysteine S-methyltransferase